MATGQVPAVKADLVDPVVDWETGPAPSLHRSRILVVDDDSGVRETIALLLAAAGYEISSAHSGFEALQQLKIKVPTLLLCDLEMPGMSGFELLSIVRRRFPGVAVIAMSGSYRGDTVPEAALADAFYCKGQQTPPMLFRIVADVMRRFASGMRSRQTGPPPVWGRWIGKDTCGTSYVLVTCEDCLRSFPVAVSTGKSRTICEAACIFCGSGLRYIADPHAADENCYRSVFSTLTHDRLACIISQTAESQPK